MKLLTRRLDLVAATPALLRAELDSPSALAASLGVAVPQGWPAPLNSRESVEYTLRFLEGGPDRAGWMSWYFIQGRDLVGLGGFTGLPVDGSVEIGYSILDQYQRQGLATEAMTALIAHAFSFPEIQTIAAQTLPDLTASIRTAERLGFTFTGPGSEAGVIRYSLCRL
jgi:[ribosomal protein S5]-alanine N-acetyltransferase